MGEATPPVQCQIRIRGQLGETLLAAFPDLDEARYDGETALVGVLRPSLISDWVSEGMSCSTQR